MEVMGRRVWEVASVTWMVSHDGVMVSLLVVAYEPVG